jgi:hypothetical protein
MNYMPSGLMGLNLTPCERRVAAAARQLASGQQALYHGTRYLHRILSDGVLQFARIGLKAVSLSRLPEMAVFAAILPRDDTYEAPSILVLDRDSLRSRYRLECYHEDWPGHGTDWRDEAEEIIYGRDVDDLNRHLIGAVVSSSLHDPMCTACIAGRRRYCEHMQS